MVIVIASIHVKDGKAAEYLGILKEHLSAVRNEKGCIEYVPAVDRETTMSLQDRDGNMVTILEKWESMDALHAHLGSPHMQAYRERVKNLVVRISLKVLGEAG